MQGRHWWWDTVFQYGRAELRGPRQVPGHRAGRDSSGAGLGRLQGVSVCDMTVPEGDVPNRPGLSASDLQGDALLGRPAVVNDTGLRAAGSGRGRPSAPPWPQPPWGLGETWARHRRSA